MLVFFIKKIYITFSEEFIIKLIYFSILNFVPWQKNIHTQTHAYIWYYILLSPTPLRYKSIRTNYVLSPTLSQQQKRTHYLRIL